VHIISESVLMLFTKIIKISPCLSKLQLDKFGSFFETQCRELKAACSHLMPLQQHVCDGVACPANEYILA